MKYFIKKGNKNALILLEKKVQLVHVTEHLNKKYSANCIRIHHNAFRKHKLPSRHDLTNRIKLSVLHCTLYIRTFKTYSSSQNGISGYWCYEIQITLKKSILWRCTCNGYLWISHLIVICHSLILLVLNTCTHQQ